MRHRLVNRFSKSLYRSCLTIADLSSAAQRVHPSPSTSCLVDRAFREKREPICTISPSNCGGISAKAASCAKKVGFLLKARTSDPRRCGTATSRHGNLAEDVHRLEGDLNPRPPPLLNVCKAILIALGLYFTFLISLDCRVQGHRAAGWCYRLKTVRARPAIPTRNRRSACP